MFIVIGTTTTSRHIQSVKISDRVIQKLLQYLHIYATFFFEHLLCYKFSYS